MAQASLRKGEDAARIHNVWMYLATLTTSALAFQPKSLCAGPFILLECNAGAFLCLGSTCLVITSIA